MTVRRSGMHKVAHKVAMGAQPSLCTVKVRLTGQFLNRSDAQPRLCGAQGVSFEVVQVKLLIFKGSRCTGTIRTIYLSFYQREINKGYMCLLCTLVN